MNTFNRKHTDIFGLAAILFLLATTNTQAAVTVIDNDSFTYKIAGDIQIQLLQQVGTDQDLDINFDDSELKNSFSYDLGGSLTGFAKLDFDAGRNNEVRREEAYVGMEYGPASFWFGATDFATDSFGVDRNIDVVSVDGDSFPVSGSSDVVLFSYDAGFANFSFSHDLEVENDLSATDLYISGSLGPVSLAIGLQSATNVDAEITNGSAIVADVDTIGISGVYDVGVATLGVAFSTADYDVADDDVEIIHVSVGLPVLASATVSIGFDTVKGGATRADADAVYANIIYKFPQAKNFRTFFEIGQLDIDGVDSLDVGYLGGIRLTF